MDVGGNLAPDEEIGGRVLEPRAAAAASFSVTPPGPERRNGSLRRSRTRPGSAPIEPARRSAKPSPSGPSKSAIITAIASGTTELGTKDARALARRSILSFPPGPDFSFLESGISQRNRESNKGIADQSLKNGRHVPFCNQGYQPIARSENCRIPVRDSRGSNRRSPKLIHRDAGGGVPARIQSPKKCPIMIPDRSTNRSGCRRRRGVRARGGSAIRPGPRLRA